MTAKAPVINQFLDRWSTYLADQQIHPKVQTLRLKLNTSVHPLPHLDHQHQAMLIEWHTRTAVPAWLSTAGLHREAENFSNYPLRQNPDTDHSYFMEFLDQLNTALVHSANQLSNLITPVTSRILRNTALMAIGASAERATRTTHPGSYASRQSWLLAAKLEYTAHHAAIVTALRQHRRNPKDANGHTAEIALKPTIQRLQNSVLALLDRMRELE